MNENLNNLLQSIEKRITHDDILEFKIGSTGQKVEDRLKGADYTDYNNIKEIASGLNADIKEAERYLIQYFKNKFEKCKNTLDGAGNIDNVNKLYIAQKVQLSTPPSMVDIHIENIDLFGFPTITL